MLESATMNECPGERHIPVVICSVHDSPVDALISMHVPQDEAMALVTASWPQNGVTCLLAAVDGGRHVAAVRLPDGHWAAGNAFVADGCMSRQDAERRLLRLLKRGRTGTVGVIGPFRGAEMKKPVQD